MKTIILLLSILNFVYFVNGQEIPQMIFKTWQFKPDRNLDFGLDLSNTISNPGFCCGDSEVESTNDPNVIVVHGENSVSQWFADAPYGVVDDSQCPSYRVDFPFEYFIECPDCNFGEISSYPFSYSDIGFNNQTLFNYDNDIDQGLFCFEPHFSFRFNGPIPISRLPIFAFLTIDSPGEIWAFIDNQLVIDKGGIGFSENPYGEHLIFGNDYLNHTHTANIFGYQHMDNVDHREFFLAI